MSFNFKRIIFRFRAPGSKSPLLALTVFLASGLVHEYLAWASFRMLTGENLVFFVVTGAATIVQVYLTGRLEFITLLQSEWPIATRLTAIFCNTLFFALMGKHFINVYVQGPFFHEQTYAWIGIKYWWLV